jgi:2'-5' RNA ligase
VTAFKRYCAEHFGASHSLISPPHITIVPPFSRQTDELPSLTAALDSFAKAQSALEIGLNGFGSFPPRVIFVDVEPNQELTELATKLATHLNNKIGLNRESAFGFNPHMTIAHRDLQHRVFPKAWAYFVKKEFQRKFNATALTLLRHEQSGWKMVENFPLT